MTRNGPFDAVSLPIFGVLGKARRATLSARRVVALSGPLGPDAAPAVPPVTAPSGSPTEPAGAPSSPTGMGD